MKRIKKSSIRLKKSRQHVIGVAVILAVAVSGSFLILASHAQTPYVSSEAEAGALAGGACLGSDGTASGGSYVGFGGSSCSTSTASAPATPSATGALICGNSSQLNGPTTAPAGSVSVPAGNNSSVFDNSLPNSTTYYFAAGTHTLGTGEFSQIDPGNNDTFIGAPGAIINGQNENNYAFVANNGKNVTIQYLTIENFTPPGGEAAVNQGSGDGWTIENNTIQDNVPGSGVYLGTNNTMNYNCITANGDQGWGAYVESDFAQATIDPLTGGPDNVQINHNEISFNNTCNWEADSAFNGPKPPSGCNGAGEYNGCGCAGGGKFWETNGGTFNDNYVHDNYDVGVWADTDNVGISFDGNYLSNNDAPAIDYEISYNTQIENNTLVNNDWIDGNEGGYPDGAIFISNAGSDSRVAGNYNTSTVISGNVLTNDWAGIILWQDADRPCGSIGDNTSTGTCTLVNPSVASLSACSNATDLAKTPYINDCQWKTQNVLVTHNTFSLTPSAIGSSCTLANQCGITGMFSEYGTIAPYDGYLVPNNLMNNQNNVYSDNTYTGPWNFMVFTGGTVENWAKWQSGYTDADSGDHIAGQDAGSTYSN